MHIHHLKCNHIFKYSLVSKAELINIKTNTRTTAKPARQFSQFSLVMLCKYFRVYRGKDNQFLKK